MQADDIADAALLLAQRHRRHRLAAPMLSPRFEDPQHAEAELTAALARPDASGVVALRRGVMVGYLLGAPKDDTWGPNIWVEAAGQAVIEPETIRDLYGAAAARWVDEGRTAHFVMTPATDADLVRAWFHLCFGIQHVHAMRAPLVEVPVPAKVTIRRATAEDVPVLAELDLVLPTHQCLSPTFAGRRPGTLQESIDEWTADVADPKYASFVAEYDGAVVGSAVGCSLELSSAHAGLSRAENSGFLAFAAVYPQSRGLGAGRALGEAVLAWAAEAGFDKVTTDWRAANLLSSRSWTALGFEPTFLRLHRLIRY
jgi:GNAT superfamily N-acetyltransferase